MTSFQGDGAPTSAGATGSGAAVPCGSAAPRPAPAGVSRLALLPAARPAPPAPLRPIAARPAGGRRRPAAPAAVPRAPVPEQRGREGRSGCCRRAARGRRRETAPTGSRETPRRGTARSPALTLRPAPVPRRTAGGVPLLRGPLRRSLPRRSATLGAAFQQSAKRSRAASSPSSRRARRPLPAGGGTARSRTAPGPPRRVPQR